VVAEGPPEVVAKVPESHTGRFLANALGIGPSRPVAKPAKSSKAVKRAVASTKKRP
jgi:excinuclease ABC subunit A